MSRFNERPNQDPAETELNSIVLDDLRENEYISEEFGISEKVKLLNMILQKAKHKMHPNIKDSSFYSYVGERRSGKSVLAIAHSFYIDPDITTENVVFTIDELKDFIYTNTKTSVMWDEAGVTAYSRDFMTRISKQLNKFFQVFGYRQIAIFTTFQHAGYLDNHLRQQLDALFWMQSSTYTTKDDNGNTYPYTRKFCRPFNVYKTPFTPPFFKAYNIYKSRDSVNPDEIGKVQVPDMENLMKFYHVHNWRAFFADYDKKKEEFFNSIDQEADAADVAMQELMDKLKTMKESHAAEIATMKEEAKKLSLNKNLVKTAIRRTDALTAFANHVIAQKQYTVTDIAKVVEIPASTVDKWLKNDLTSFLKNEYEIPQE